MSHQAPMDNPNLKAILMALVKHSRSETERETCETCKGTYRENDEFFRRIKRIV